MNCFRYSVRELYKRSKIYTLLYLAFSYIIISTSVLQLILTQKLVNSLTYYSDDLEKQIMQYIIALIVILYIDGLLTSIRGVSLTHLIEIGIYEDENIILSKSCKLSVINLDSPDIKDLRNKAKRINIFDIANSHVDFSVAVIKTIIYCILIIYYRCYLLLPVIFLGLIIKSRLQRNSGNKIEQIDRKQTASNRVSEYLYNLLVNRDTMQEIKIAGIANYLNEKRKEIYLNNYYERVKVVKENELRLFGIGSVITFCNILALCLLVILCRRYDIAAGVYVLLMQIVIQLYSMIPTISQGYGKIKTLKIQFEEYKKYLDLEEDSSMQTVENTLSDEALGVKLNNVSFKYPDSKKEALSEINIDIKPRERVAFVGENGSGKSTLVKIILGIYSPDVGNIQWYDSNNSNGKSDDSKLKVVFQDFIRLLRPIRENVAMGNIYKINDNKAVNDAIIKAGTPNLEEKLDEYIGPEFGGSDLSGGQWQKLSIARSYMKDGKLAVFDEATSALDAQAELQQYQSFFAQGVNITSIIVTHRLSITKMVDKIYVIHDGKIVEYGSHNELYKKNGMYKKMYDAQSTFYA